MEVVSLPGKNLSSAERTYFEYTRGWDFVPALKTAAYGLIDPTKRQLTELPKDTMMTMSIFFCVCDNPDCPRVGPGDAKPVLCADCAEKKKNTGVNKQLAGVFRCWNPRVGCWDLYLGMTHQRRLGGAIFGPGSPKAGRLEQLLADAGLRDVVLTAEQVTAQCRGQFPARLKYPAKFVHMKDLQRILQTAFSDDPIKLRKVPALLRACELSIQRKKYWIPEESAAAKKNDAVIAAEKEKKRSREDGKGKEEADEAGHHSDDVMVIEDDVNNDDGHSESLVLSPARGGTIEAMMGVVPRKKKQVKTVPAVQAVATFVDQDEVAGLRAQILALEKTAEANKSLLKTFVASGHSAYLESDQFKKVDKIALLTEYKASAAYKKSVDAINKKVMERARDITRRARLMEIEVAERIAKAAMDQATALELAAAKLRIVFSGDYPDPAPVASVVFPEHAAPRGPASPAAAASAGVNDPGQKRPAKKQVARQS